MLRMRAREKKTVRNVGWEGGWKGGGEEKRSLLTGWEGALNAER